MKILIFIGAVLAPMLFPAKAIAEPEQGWTLYSGLASTHARLVDMDGKLVHDWPSAFTPAASVYLLDDGAILRPAADPLLPGPNGGGGGGRIQIIGWDGALLWDFVLARVPDHPPAPRCAHVAQRQCARDRVGISHGG